MTIYTEEIDSFSSLEIARSFAMYTGFPVAINISVALSAKQVRFCKIYVIPIGELQFIPVGGIMTIKTPSITFSMVKFDAGMFVLKFPFFCIDLYTCMTVAAGEYTLGQWWSGNGIFIMMRCRSGDDGTDYYKQHQ